MTVFTITVILFHSPGQVSVKPESGVLATCKIFLIKENKGIVCVYDESGATLIKDSGIPVRLLPASVEEFLKGGIEVSGERRVKQLLEEFSS